VNWIVLHPAGDTVTVLEANVAAAVLLPGGDREHAAKVIRRLALERELAELDAELGDMLPAAPALEQEVGAEDDPDVGADSPAVESFAGTFVGADGVARTERHFTERRPGTPHICVCGRAFNAGDRLAQHQRSCAESRAWTSARGQSAGRVWGSSTPAFDPTGTSANG